jgi:hypothetical protein
MPRKKLRWKLRSSDGGVLMSNALHVAQDLEVTLSNGGVIRVELHERVPGYLSIRARDGQLVIRPEVSNAVSVRNDTDYEMAQRADHTSTKKKRR